MEVLGPFRIFRSFSSTRRTLYPSSIFSRLLLVHCDQQQSLLSRELNSDSFLFYSPVFSTFILLNFNSERKIFSQNINSWPITVTAKLVTAAGVWVPQGRGATAWPSSPAASQTNVLQQSGVGGLLLIQHRWTGTRGLRDTPEHSDHRSSSRQLPAKAMCLLPQKQPSCSVAARRTR